MRTPELPRRHRIRVLALVDSPEAADEVRTTLSARTDLSLDVRVEPLAGAQVRIASLSPDILLLDINDQADLKALEDMSAVMTRMPVIVTAQHVDLDTAKRLMRLGVVDVLVRPLNADDARAAIDAARLKVSQTQREGGPRGAVVAFMSSCGGGGATTLAVETAFGLLGDKATRRTCVLDFDVQFGNAALLLDIHGANGLMQILESPERLDGAFLEGAMMPHKSGLHILAAPPSIVPLDAFGTDTVGRVVDLARELYDFTVVDMPHAWTSWTTPVLARADLIVLVTQVNVVALQRARRQLSLIHDQGLEAAPLVVLANQFEKGWSSRGTLKQAEAALGHAIDHCVRPDPATVAAARDQGVPLRAIKRGNKVEKDLAALCTEIRELRKAEPVLTAVA